MKTFLLINKYKNSAYAQNVTQQIYRIKKNNLIYLGEHYFNTGSMTGEDHEGFGWLVKNKYLPRTYINGGKEAGTIYIDWEKHDKLYKIISK